MSHVDGRLTDRQRTAPPIDRRSARRGRSGGGYDFVEGARTLAPGIETEQSRYPGTVNDTQILRDRRPWYHREEYRPVAQSWVNWTEAGPVRPELHMRTTDFRVMEGNTTSRYPFVPGSPTGGRHTMVPSGPGGNVTAARFVGSGLPQMRAARPDRLAAARYSGQSYSQTTAVQGHSRRR